MKIRSQAFRCRGSARMSQAVCYVEITLTRCARSSQSIGLCRAGIFGVPQSSSSRRLFPVVSQPWRLFRSRSVEGCPSGCSPARVCRHRAGPRPLGFVEPFGLSLAPRHCNENLGRDYQRRCGSIGHIQPGHCLFAASPPLSAIKPARISARMSRSSSVSAPAPGGCAPPPDHV